MIQTLFGSVEQEPTLLEKLKSGVQKTRDGLVSRIEDVLSGRKEIDADLLEELEYTLISADIGVKTTEEILERIRERVDRKLVGELRGLIREFLLEILQSSNRPLFPPAVRTICRGTFTNGVRCAAVRFFLEAFDMRTYGRSAVWPSFQSHRMIGFRAAREP